MTEATLEPDALFEDLEEPFEEPAAAVVRTPARPSVPGPDKAAMLLVTLGSERAAQILQHLSEQEIERLSLKMAKLGQVSGDAAEGVFEEVLQTALAAGYLAEGGVGFAREVLERSLGSERAAEIIGRLSAMMEMRPFEFLRRTPPEQIWAALRGEAPQTVALVVSNLHTTLAAQVLAQLPPDRQADVARRVANMTEISPDIVREVEGVIRQKLSNVISQEYAASGGVKSLADILNHADRPTERNVIDTLSESDPVLAEEIRNLLFVFEDIVKIDDRSVQLVLREVDQNHLTLALRGASEEVKQKIVTNMSQRGAEMLLEEIEFLPPQRRSAVEEAQSAIVAVIRRLEQTGAIVLGRGSGDDEVI